jgi:hypothetical protein
MKQKLITSSLLLLIFFSIKAQKQYDSTMYRGELIVNKAKNMGYYALHNPDTIKDYNNYTNWVQNAPFIFEGKRLRQKTINVNGIEYVSNEFRIATILKNNSKKYKVGDTIEIAQNVFVPYGYIPTSSHGYNYNTGWVGFNGYNNESEWANDKILFLKEETIIKKQFSNTKQSFAFFENTERQISMIGFNEEEEWYMHGSCITFFSKEALIKDMLLYDNILCPKGYEKYKPLSKLQKNAQASPYLFTKIINQQLTNSNTYYEYDIQIYTDATSGAFFNSYNLAVWYDTTAFVPNLANTASNITVTMQVPFSTTNSVRNGVNTPTYSLIAPATVAADCYRLKVNINAALSSGTVTMNRLATPTTFTTLLHVKLKLKPVPCLNALEQAINIDDTQTYATYKAASNTPYTGTLYYFDMQYYNSFFRALYEACAAANDDIIDQNTINTGMRAGFGEVLTLTAPAGKHFGTTRCTKCYVSFIDAHNPNEDGNNRNKQNNMNDSYDIISWSDTEIKVRLFSTSFFPNDNNEEKKVRCVGSGQVYIQLATGRPLKSNYLKVSQAIINLQTGSGATLSKVPGLLVRRNCKSGLQFKIHQSVANAFPNKPYRTVIQKALKQWSDSLLIQTGNKINLTLLTGTTNDTLNPDFVVIRALPVLQGVVGTATMKTVMSLSSIANTSSFSSVYYYPEQIQIKTSGITWDFNADITTNLLTGQADFYGSISHEIGHTLGAEHVCSENTFPEKELMYYTRLTGAQASNRGDVLTADKKGLNSIKSLINVSKDITFTNPVSVSTGLNDYNTANSHTYSVQKINQFAGITPVILTQPISKTICLGQDFSVNELTAQNNIGKYCWQYLVNPAESDTWHTIYYGGNNILFSTPNATNFPLYANIMNTVKANAGTYNFRCVVQGNDGCDAISNTVKLNVVNCTGSPQLFLDDMTPTSFECAPSTPTTIQFTLIGYTSAQKIRVKRNTTVLYTTPNALATPNGNFTLTFPMPRVTNSTLQNWNLTIESFPASGSTTTTATSNPISFTTCCAQITNIDGSITYTACSLGGGSNATSNTSTMEERIIQTNFDVAAMQIFPNPAQNELQIVLPNIQNTEAATLKIYDAKGQIIQTIKPNTNNLQINTQNYPSGIYLIQYHNGLSTQTQKIIIQH